MRRMYGLFTYMKAEEWPHPRGNVGKYSLQGASGMCFLFLVPEGSAYNSCC